MTKVLVIVHQTMQIIYTVDKCFELKLIFMFEAYREQYVLKMGITGKKRSINNNTKGDDAK